MVLEDLVAVALGVERERVLEAGAAAAAHADAQAGGGDVGALRGQELLDLLGALLGERDHGRILVSVGRSNASGSVATPTDLATLRIVPTTDELKQRIEASIPGASADVVDLNGGGDHFRATVVAPEFAGLSRIEQHRRVYAVFGRRHRRPDPRPVPHHPSRSVGLHMSTSPSSRSARRSRRRSPSNDVILFMKGTPEAPRCGFSARTVAALEALGTPFAAVDILPDPRIRQELSALSNWPTIPQLFVRGELVGGCDIITEMYESGELAETLGVERRRGAGEAPRPPRRRAAARSRTA